MTASDEASDDTDAGAPPPPPAFPPGNPGTYLSEEDGGDLVVGVFCRRAHFNDPRTPYCAICGISMAQSSPVPDLGRRPSLGVLVMDDGTTLPLARDLVFGRAPENDAAVIAGAAQPVRLSDRSVSRVHARVVLDDWDVRIADNGSKNGSFVRRPGQTLWNRIPAGHGIALWPGSTVALGPRRFWYHSHRAQSGGYSILPSLRTGE